MMVKITGIVNCTRSQAALTALASTEGRHQPHADVQQLALEGFLESSAAATFFGFRAARKPNCLRLIA